MNLFERGMKLIAKADKQAGGHILYERGSWKVWLEATYGRTLFEISDSDGVRTEYNDRDFIFSAESLILGGERAIPERGDRITIVGKEYVDRQVFEVLAPTGDQVFRLCDADGLRIRVHTKRVA